MGAEIGDRIQSFLEGQRGRSVQFKVTMTDQPFHESDIGEVDPSIYEYTRELTRRDTATVTELKALYKGRCQITGMACIEGIAGDITEAHHIVWLSRGGADAASNMIVLSPNYHRAVHATDGYLRWDGKTPLFVIGGKPHQLMLNLHLQP